MTKKLIIMMIIFAINPLRTLAYYQLAIATISETEKSELTQEVETVQLEDSNTNDKLIMEEINKTQETVGVINTQKVVAFIVIIIALILIIRFIFK